MQAGLNGTLKVAGVYGKSEELRVFAVWFSFRASAPRTWLVASSIGA